MPKMLIRQVKSLSANVLECSPLCFAFVILIRAFMLFCSVTSRTIFTGPISGKKNTSRQENSQANSNRLDARACWTSNILQGRTEMKRHEPRCSCTYIALFFSFRVLPARYSWHSAANYWFSWTMSLFRGGLNILAPHLCRLRDVPDL